jgi:tetratricopeptide (TPR) repeat protein
MSLWRTARSNYSDSLRDAAEADLRAAVARRGDMSNAWSTLSVLFQITGQYDKARETAEAALKSDAFLKNASQVINRLLFTSLSTGRTSDARKWCAQGQRQFPRYPPFWGCEFTILGWNGKTSADVGAAWVSLAASEARDSANSLASGWATRRLLIASIAARAGMKDSALAIARAVRTNSAKGGAAPPADYGEAYVLALVGQKDSAISLLERYVRSSPAFRSQVKYSPWFTALRDDPRFIALTAAK